MFVVDKGEQFKKQAHFADLTKVFVTKKNRLFCYKSRECFRNGAKEIIKKLLFSKAFVLVFVEVSLAEETLIYNINHHEVVETWSSWSVTFFFWYQIAQALLLLQIGHDVKKLKLSCVTWQLVTYFGITHRKLTKRLDVTSVL